MTPKPKYRITKTPSIRWLDLRDALLANGADILTIARVSGATLASIQAIFAGRGGQRFLSAATFMALCEYLAVDPWNFYTGRRSQPSHEQTTCHQLRHTS